MRLLLIAFVATVFCIAQPSTAGAQSANPEGSGTRRGLERAAAQRETQSHLESLIQLDTQNPPGNEALAAAWFDSVFGALEGVETHVLEAAPGRANFVVRLRAGRPAKKPVLLMGHMDVVGVDTTKWETPAFEPTVKDGYLYGRGAIDDKGMLATATTAFLQLAKERESLQRDIIFLGTAAEESGGTEGIA